MPRRSHMSPNGPKPDGTSYVKPPDLKEGMETPWYWVLRDAKEIEPGVVAAPVRYTDGGQSIRQWLMQGPSWDQDDKEHPPAWDACVPVYDDSFPGCR